MMNLDATIIKVKRTLRVTGVEMALRAVSADTAGTKGDNARAKEHQWRTSY